jgi:hypothetical protein
VVGTSMKRWQYVAIGTVAGAAVTLGGTYLYFRPFIVFLGQSAYVSAASQGRLDVHALRLLRNGDIDGATRLMESRLQLEEATLSGYESAFPIEHRDGVVMKGIELVSAYRKEYPVAAPPNKSLERSRER